MHNGIYALEAQWISVDDFWGRFLVVVIESVQAEINGRAASASTHVANVIHKQLRMQI